MFSQDAINRELRTLARAEARERLPEEVHLLRAGHIDQEDVRVARALPLRTPRRWQAPVLGLLGAAQRVRGVVLGSSR